MLHRWFLYCAALGAAVLFQIFSDSYLPAFLLTLMILLPFLSLALSLPGMLSCSLELDCPASAVTRGGTAGFQAILHCPVWLPLARVRMVLSCVNQLTGETRTLRREFRGALNGAQAGLEVDARHCGHLLCQAVRVRVCDLLGLFPLPVRRGPAAALLVLPVSVEPELPPELTGERQAGVRLRPRPGGGPGEDYDLRDYRPGDPMKSVHWKLSTKRDELVVREVLEPCQSELILTFDLFGPIDDLDRTFDRLYALSLWLLEKERPHRIQWAAPASGEVVDCPVTAQRELQAALTAAFSQPAPCQGKSILDRAIRAPGAAAARVLHVTPNGLEGGGL